MVLCSYSPSAPSSHLLSTDFSQSFKSPILPHPVRAVFFIIFFAICLFSVYYTFHFAFCPVVFLLPCYDYLIVLFEYCD